MKAKIEKIDLSDGGTFKLNNKEGNSTITEIKEGTHQHGALPLMFGFTIHNENGRYAWVPYHAVTTIYFEVENES